MNDLQSGGHMTSGSGRMKRCIWSTAAHESERNGDLTWWTSLSPTDTELMQIKKIPRSYYLVVMI